MHSPAVTAIYARKSRPNESALGSCEVQAAICRDTAEAFSWEIKEVFADDGGSSETLDRPAMSRLIEQIELGVIRRLIVDRADRLSRKLHVTAQLMELFDRYEVDLIVVTDPNFGLSAASRLTVWMARYRFDSASALHRCRRRNSSRRCPRSSSRSSLYTTNPERLGGFCRRYLA